MNLTSVVVMATVTTLFILGVVVSKYFALAAVITLAIVLFAEPCKNYLYASESGVNEMNNVLPSSNEPDFSNTTSFLNPTEASPVAYETPIDPAMSLQQIHDGDEGEEAAALRRIEAAQESFHILDDDDAVKWGEGQDAFIQEYRLNNMGDDTNTVTYLHPDYENKYPKREMDIWNQKSSNIGELRARSMYE
jgi:hypothetical protein